jgi:hypothetical protein
MLIVGMAALTALAGAACGDDSDSSDVPAADNYTGIVTEVESEGLNEVTSFGLKTEDDETLTILIDESVNYGFPLGHLEEHRVTAGPVEVAVEERDGELYAQSIVDVEGG